MKVKIQSIEELKKKRKIVSDNIWELTIIINGENADSIPARKNNFTFIVLAMCAMTIQFMASIRLCITKTLNKFSPTSQMIN